MFEIALLIAVVVGLTEIIKQFGVDKKYLPIASLILGVLVGVFYLGGSLEENIMYGVIIGLSASGLFDQSKILKGDN